MNCFGTAVRLTSKFDGHLDANFARSLLSSPCITTIWISITMHPLCRIHRCLYAPKRICLMTHNGMRRCPAANWQNDRTRSEQSDVPITLHVPVERVGCVDKCRYKPQRFPKLPPSMLWHAVFDEVEEHNWQCCCVLDGIEHLPLIIVCTCNNKALAKSPYVWQGKNIRDECGSISAHLCTSSTGLQFQIYSYHPGPHFWCV